MTKQYNGIVFDTRGEENMRLLLSFVIGHPRGSGTVSQVLEVDVPRGRAAHVVVQEEMDKISKERILFCMNIHSFQFHTPFSQRSTKYRPAKNVRKDGFRYSLSLKQKS